MNLSVIIVSYNVEFYLRQCLKSVFASKNIEDMEVIVVDNYSFDQSVHMINTEFPKVKLIGNTQNIGFARAVNLGLKIAKGTHICILNPDTLIQSNTFSILVNYLNSNPEVGCVGPKILNIDGSLQKSCKRSFPFPLVALPKFLGLSRIFPKNKYFGKYNLTYLNEDQIHNVDAISGSFMMLSKMAIDKIGNMDERFFMFGEDLDYCFRVHEAGFKVIYYPLTQIIHYKGESIKSSPKDMIKVFYNAMIIFFEKYQYKFSSWRFIKWVIKSAIYIRQIFASLFYSSERIAAKTIDITFIILSFTTAIELWYPLIYSDRVPRSLMGHFWLIFNVIIIWVIASYILRLYRKNILSYGRAAVTTLLMFFIASTTTYFISIFAYSRGVLIISSIFILLLNSSWRVLVHLMYRYGKVNFELQSPLFTRRAAILGTGAESLRIGSVLETTPEADFHLKGYIGKTVLITNRDMVLGRYEDIKGIIKHHNINELIIPERLFPIESLINILQDIVGLNVVFKLVPEGTSLLVGKGIVENLSGVTMVNIDFPIFERLHLISKRLFDIIFAIIGLTITLPFQLYYWIFTDIIKRIVWKENGQMISLVEFSSSRKWIRELPLLYSILLGDISVVGCKIIDIYTPDPKLIIKPGLTGLSQLKNQQYGNIPSAEVDHYYIQNQSVIFDLEILLKSILKV